MGGAGFGLFGSKGKTKEHTEQTQGGTQTGGTQQRLDPQSQAFVDFMRKQAMESQRSIQGHEGSFIAGPNQSMRSGLGTMDFISQFRPDFQAQQIGAERVGDPLNVGGGGFGAGLNFNPEQLDISRIQDFMNPFESQVIGGMEQDAQRQREAVLSAAQQQATQAGAFGGSRGEVLQAQGLRDVNQDAGMRMAQTRSAGFGQALQAAMGEHGLLQNLGLGAAQADLQGRLHGQGLGLQAGLANQAAGLQAMGMNQQAALQAAMANQQAGLQAGGLNLQGLGLALQGGQAQFQSGEHMRQLQQQFLQEPIMRAQLGQDFLTQGLGPTGMDSSTQQAFNQWMDQMRRGRSQQFGGELTGQIGV